MSQVITRSIDVTIHQPGFDVDFGSYESDQSVEVILDHIIKGDPGPQGPSGPQGPEGPQGPSVQSDWNQTDNTALDFIKNKPTIPSQIIVDNALSTTSENPVQNKVITSALGNKADKVSGATNGHLAGLDANGNLTDSGKKASDFPTIIIPSTDGNISHMTSAEIASLKVGDIIVSQTLTGDVNFYVTKITGSTDGSRVYAVNVNEQRIVTITFVKTSGTWAYQDSTTLNIGNKADKVVSATNGHLAGLNSSGNLTDSGYAPSDFPKIVIPSVDGTIQNMTNDEIASLELGDIVLQSNWMNYFVVKKSGNGNGSEILLTYVDNDSIIVIRLKRANNLWAYDRYWSISLSNINSIKYKADKVANATNGNFAGLDSNGNLTDSGSKASDFATAAQGALADTAYQKPLTGIPASDLESGVIPVVLVEDVTVGGTSVVSNGVAAVPTIPDVSGKEDTSNKVTSLSSSSTDTEYPSAKAVYDIVGDIETLLAAI